MYNLHEYLFFTAATEQRYIALTILRMLL